MHDAPRRLKSPVTPLMTQIHPTAVVDPAARLHESVVVGPYTIVGPHVEIGAGTTEVRKLIISEELLRD